MDYILTMNITCRGPYHKGGRLVLSNFLMLNLTCSKSDVGLIISSAFQLVVVLGWVGQASLAKATPGFRVTGPMRPTLFQILKFSIFSGMARIGLRSFTQLSKSGSNTQQATEHSIELYLKEGLPSLVPL